MAGLSAFRRKVPERGNRIGSDHGDFRTRFDDGACRSPRRRDPVCLGVPDMGAPFSFDFF